MGIAVGNVLMSYDVNKSHTLVKTALENMGYYNNFKYEGDSKNYLLPYTTMWHPTKSSDQASNDLKLICRNLK